MSSTRSSTESNKFCPNCSTLLHPVEKFADDSDDEIEEKDGGLYLMCGDCAYHEKAVSFSASHFSNKIEKVRYVHPKRLIADYVYDMTYKRTKKQSCANKECPSQGKENPEIVLITNENYPEIAFLCTVCKHVWGKI